MQRGGTRGRWRSSTGGRAHVHTAADDPNHQRREREGQHWDQVCPQALAAKPEQVRVKTTGGRLHSMGPKALVFLWAWGRGRRQKQLLLEVLCGPPATSESGSHGPSACKGRTEPGPPPRKPALWKATCIIPSPAHLHDTHRTFTTFIMGKNFATTLGIKS